MMRRAAHGSWRAAAWLLERTDPERYAKRPASSASPEQFEGALTVVLEAALEATAPDERSAVFAHVQAACERAFKCVFPSYGQWGRRTSPTPPPTPLADEQHVQRLRQPPANRQVADDGASRVARPEAPRRAWSSEDKCPTTPFQGVPPKTRRIGAVTDPTHSAEAESVSDRTPPPSACGLQPPASDYRLPWQLPLRAALSAQSLGLHGATSASILGILGERILSPKTRPTTKFQRDKR